MKTITDRVFYLMNENSKLNETQFSKKIGVSQSTIHSLKNSKDGHVKSNVLVGIKKAYPQINMDWLLFGTGEMYLANSQAEKIINGDGNNVNIGQGNTIAFADYDKAMQEKEKEIARLQGQVETIERITK